MLWGILSDGISIHNVYNFPVIIGLEEGAMNKAFNYCTEERDCHMRSYTFRKNHLNPL